MWQPAIKPCSPFKAKLFGKAKHDRKQEEFYVQPIMAVNAIHYADEPDRLIIEIIQSIRTLTLLKQKAPGKRQVGII